MDEQIKQLTMDEMLMAAEAAREIFKNKTEDDSTMFFIGVRSKGKNLIISNLPHEQISNFLQEIIKNYGLHEIDIIRVQ